MWHDFERQVEFVRARQREYLAAAERARLIRACGQPLGLSRRAARPLGRLLFTIGAWLLRYGKDEHVPALRDYRAPARSVELN